MKKPVASYVLAGLAAAFALSHDDAQAQKFAAEWLSEAPVEMTGQQSEAVYTVQPSVLTVALSGLDSTLNSPVQDFMNEKYHTYRAIIGAGNRYISHDETVLGHKPLTINMEINGRDMSVDIVSGRDSTHIDLQDDAHKAGHYTHIRSWQRKQLNDSISTETQRDYVWNKKMFAYKKEGIYLKILEMGSVIATVQERFDDNGDHSSDIEIRRPSSDGTHYRFDRLVSVDQPYHQKTDGSDKPVLHETSAVFLRNMNNMLSPAARNLLQPYVMAGK